MVKTIERIFKLLCDDEIGDVIRITDVHPPKRGETQPRKEITYYSVARMPGNGNVYSLKKLVHSDELPEGHIVTTQGHERGCTCSWGTYKAGQPKPGGGVWQQCRHFDAVVALIESGEL